MSHRPKRVGSRGALTLILFALGPGAEAFGAQDPLNLGALGRPADEVARDATSKPLAVYEFLGVRAGTVVADLIAGGGYNTAILTHVVGADGVVFSQDGRRGAVAARKATGDLKGRANVVTFGDLSELPPDSLDVALTVRNYHDVAPEQIPAFLASVKRALKPGGVLGIIDVRAKSGGEPRPTDLHRISEDVVVKEVAAAGFELEARSDLLANPKDAYGSSEFENREGTDRMLLKFRRPAEGGAGETASNRGAEANGGAADQNARDEQPGAN